MQTLIRQSLAGMKKAGLPLQLLGRPAEDVSYVPAVGHQASIQPVRQAGLGSITGTKRARCPTPTQHAPKRRLNKPVAHRHLVHFIQSQGIREGLAILAKHLFKLQWQYRRYGSTGSTRSAVSGKFDAGSAGSMVTSLQRHNDLASATVPM